MLIAWRNYIATAINNFSVERKGSVLSDTPLDTIRSLHPERVKPIRKSWEVFLANARKKFLVDELVFQNGLPVHGMNGLILEVDNAASELTNVLRQHNYLAEKVSWQELLHTQNKAKYGIVTSHNQLEHLPSVLYVEDILNKESQHARFGMVHQVHAADDPVFDWDESHVLRLKGAEWEQYFRQWAEDHASEGWAYLNNHRGAPGRARNFVLERNGSFPFYTHYEEQTIRKIVAELTLANGISAARIPLLFLAFGLARKNPYLLSGFLGAIHALDAADGYVSRKGFGNSPHGPMIDIYSDHIAEAVTMYKFAYEMNNIPKAVPWIITARNISTDLLRFTNAIHTQKGTLENHPHEAFGTVGSEGRIARMQYGLIKAIGDMIIPVIPQSGLYVSAVHVAASINRAIPVWTSPTSRKICEELITRIKESK